jgi:putative transposase
MDIFAVPTFTCGVLYCIVVIGHNRPRVLCCNVPRHPATAWAAQQLREAFPYDSAPRYFIFDREHTFQGEVLETSESLGVRTVQTRRSKPREEWGAKRFVGSCRRELLRFMCFQEACKMLKILVGERGFEPPTPWSRTRFRRLLKAIEIARF